MHLPSWKRNTRSLQAALQRAANRAMLIVEAASVGELNQLVQGLPAWGRFKIAVTPLRRFSDSVEQQRGKQPSATVSDETPNREIHKHLGQLRDLAGK